jgi:6-phosphogluconolactonase
MTGRVALYSAVDDALTHYDVDLEAAGLTRRETIKVAAKVQYAWPHPSRKFLYVSTSNGGPRVRSDYNHIAAYAIGRDGALAPHGEARPLGRRAVHVCVDPAGRYTLNGHNAPASGITVHRIEADGTVGAEVGQPNALDYGTYPHQVKVFPSGRTALVVDRGNKAQADRPEDPGALRSFAFENGTLSPGPVIAPGGGYGFGPRHADFHPSKPWMYVSDERMNRLYMFHCPGDRIDAQPAYTRDTLAEPHNVRPRQLAGPIHVHPRGRCVYVANRADQTVEAGGKPVFGGGENNIAVYAIDAATGEPTLVQHAETHSFHVRTFACDPTGRLLVAASIKAHAVLQGSEAVPVPAALSVFRIREDGRLEFVRKYDVETPGGRLQYWMGMIGLD